VFMPTPVSYSVHSSRESSGSYNWCLWDYVTWYWRSETSQAVLAGDMNVSYKRNCSVVYTFCFLYLYTCGICFLFSFIFCADICMDFTAFTMNNEYLKSYKNVTPANRCLLFVLEQVQCKAKLYCLVAVYMEQNHWNLNTFTTWMTMTNTSKWLHWSLHDVCLTHYTLLWHLWCLLCNLILFYWHNNSAIKK